MLILNSSNFGNAKTGGIMENGLLLPSSDEEDRASLHHTSGRKA